MCRESAKQSNRGATNSLMTLASEPLLESLPYLPSGGNSLLHPELGGGRVRSRHEWVLQAAEQFSRRPQPGTELSCRPDEGLF